MNDTLPPPGLLSVARGRRMVDAIVQRVESFERHRLDLIESHRDQADAESEQTESTRIQMIDECRDRRDHLLVEWDEAAENLMGPFEARSVELQTQLRRLQVTLRRTLQADLDKIVSESEHATASIHSEYKKKAPLPPARKKKEHEAIDARLKTLQPVTRKAEEVTIGRLDYLPEVPESAQGEEAETAIADALPSDVQGVIEAINRQREKLESIEQDLHQGKAAAVIDSWKIPLGVVLMAIVWAGVAAILATEMRVLWMVIGIIPATIVGFVSYVAFLTPLKRVTRELYPKAVMENRYAMRLAKHGKLLSNKAAAKAAAKLAEDRDNAIEAVESDRVKRTDAAQLKFDNALAKQSSELQNAIETMDRDYKRNWVEVNESMRQAADSLAVEINQKLAQYSDHQNQAQASTVERQKKEHQRLRDRFEHSLKVARRRISEATDRLDLMYPAWSTVADDGASLPDTAHLPCLRLGWLHPVVHQAASQVSPQSEPSEQSSSSSSGKERNGQSISLAAVPLAIDRRTHCSIFIEATEESMTRAIEFQHALIWQMLLAANAGGIKTLLLDPIGRGQNFTEFMALTDHDPELVGHRVWTTDDQIEKQLSSWASHNEDVLQTSLRDRFSRVEDYNQVAGSLSIPYTIVAAVGFPTGLNRVSHRDLRALIGSGIRCGTWTILVHRKDEEWPADVPKPLDESILKIRVDREGKFWLGEKGKSNEGRPDDNLEVDQTNEVCFEPIEPPTASQRNSLTAKIGRRAVEAARVVVPLCEILDDQTSGRRKSDDRLTIPIGSQGAGRMVDLELGAGVKQHVLIAGKTGSGKSTLLHSIITSGCYHYRPDELQFYLVDFKKGVEFQVYASERLPHARVIGIESQREFGRSVLRNLDQELQSRGEKFREVGVSDLAGYREASKESLPRLLLIIDEFQEIFVRDDRLASECAMLLDRLVRQGRSFGIHVILASQSLAGAYSLPRATLGQMAVRIAMQCGAADAAMILSEDNTAAKLLSKPGEAIYNDAGGLIEGNQPMQVAMLETEDHHSMLRNLAGRDMELTQFGDCVVFAGNRPVSWSEELSEVVIKNHPVADGAAVGLLGEPIEIGPPLGLVLERRPGRNVLLVAEVRMAAGAVGALVSTMAMADSCLEVLHLQGARADDRFLDPWLERLTVKTKTVDARESAAEMVKVAEEVRRRTDSDASESTLVVIVESLQNHRDLKADDAARFSFGTDQSDRGDAAFQTVLSDGPAVGVFVIVTTPSVEIANRWLTRTSMHDLDWRVTGPLSANDSSLLIDSPMATELSTATMLVHDSTDGSTRKFRVTTLGE
ncbi:MAG: FtsK/SpoIIIE domain-containing protein [Planctomycetota bacterium]